MGGNRLQMILLAAICTAVTLGGCGELDKYRKPAENKGAVPPVEKTVDIRATPEERERGREFKLKLDAVRADFVAANDTMATVAALDKLLTELDTEWKSLPEESEFGTFYLLMMADILNQVSQLKRQLGDIEGARAAQGKLTRIRENLPR